MTMLPKSLSQIIANGGPVSMIDVIIVKKYPIYYNEYLQSTSSK